MVLLDNKELMKPEDLKLIWFSSIKNEPSVTLKLACYTVAEMGRGRKTQVSPKGFNMNSHRFQPVGQSLEQINSEGVGLYQTSGVEFRVSCIVEPFQGSFLLDNSLMGSTHGYSNSTLSELFIIEMFV